MIERVYQGKMNILSRARCMLLAAILTLTTPIMEAKSLKKSKKRSEFINALRVLEAYADIEIR